jgi:hypothetical protein
MLWIGIFQTQLLQVEVGIGRYSSGMWSSTLILMEGSQKKIRISTCFQKERM